MGFFNTTKTKGPLLKQFQQKTETQETIVLNIYRSQKKGLTPSEVYKNYPDRITPLTSIRRAITNLMNNRKLVKTGIQREGIYGRPEHEYRIYTGQLQMFN